MISKVLRRLFPLFIIIAAIIGYKLMLLTQEQPEQKEEEIAIPIVDVQSVTPQTLSLNLPSYGVVSPKYKTMLVTEVHGRMISLSENFVAGGIVKKGDELAVIEPSDYEADLMQAEASLAQAKAALNEEKARGEVAKIEFKGYDKGLAPALGLRIPQLKKEQANVKYAQAALARAQRNLARTTIRAPFDGIIKARNIDLGQYVTVGTNLGELYDTSVAEIRLPLSNADLGYLESVDKPDTSVTLSTTLAGKKVTWLGSVIRNENTIDEQSRMVYLVAEVRDPYLLNQRQEGQLPLKYGSFVTAVITGRTEHNVVTLPRHIVRNHQVAVVKNDNTIELRQVNVIRTDADNAFIQNSLQAGERVSITSLKNIGQGQKVKVLGEKSPTTEAKTIENDAQAIAVEGDE